jgi:hypothetical protein
MTAVGMHKHCAETWPTRYQRYPGGLERCTGTTAWLTGAADAELNACRSHFDHSVAAEIYVG